MAGGVARGATEPRDVARLRELFLSGGELPAGASVTAPILESWVRSAHGHVAADHVSPPYRALPHELPDFATVATQVLDRTTEALGDEPVCVVLTDAEGTVLLRWCGDASLRRRLDRVSLAPGFAYSEPGVGTNGIGTALERGAPTLVHATEHFTDDLVGFTCAGVPVRDPATGEVLGVVDLTTGSGRGTHLMLGFARTLAAQIEDELRRPTATHREPDPVAAGPRVASLVQSRPEGVEFPDRPGRGTAWVRAHRQVVAHAEQRRPAALVGERGTGKAHLALVAHRLHGGGSVQVLDAGRRDALGTPAGAARWLGRVAAALGRDTGSLMVRRVHRLPDDAACGLSHLLDQFATRHHRGHGPWLVVTSEPAVDRPGPSGHPLFGSSGTVEVPPLRHHAEDVPDLVALFLARHGARQLRLTPEALDVLAHHAWPGNVSELEDVVARLALGRRSGTVGVDDLPATHLEHPRHRLTALETLERDAIVRELVLRGGRKDAAAAALGISRATLYRRLHEYGIA